LISTAVTSCEAEPPIKRLMNIFLQVSGVIIANASLDIAFHDTYYVVAQMGLNSTSSLFHQYLNHGTLIELI
jgi:hypothetical protein